MSTNSPAADRHATQPRSADPTLTDWLALNGLTVAEVQAILDRAQGLVSLTVEPDRQGPLLPVEMGGEAAWRLAARAFADRLPFAQTEITLTGEATQRDFGPRDGLHELPFTRDLGPGRPAYIRCPFDGRVRDLLTVAHEFSHALQIEASQSAPMPPVAREVCAFLGERLLIAHLRQHSPELVRWVEAAWHQDNGVYLGQDGARLADALRDPGARYDYRWNYPIARILAIQVHYGAEAADIWQLFSSGSEAPVFLPVAEIHSNRAVPALALPPLADPGPEPGAAPGADTVDFGIYRLLGAAVLLEGQLGSAATQEPIGAFYAELVAHLRAGTVLVGLDQDRHPIGYVTWRPAQDDLGMPFQIGREVSPFNETQRLRKAVESRLGAVDWVAASQSEDGGAVQC